MSIGSRITELRKERNFSQEYIAQELGVSRQAVSKWEQDLSSPDTNNLIALAQLFHVSVEYLAVGSAPPDAGKRRGGDTQRILGFLFVGFGLLALILGCLFSLLLLVPAAFLLVFGTLLLAVRRRLWIALAIAGAVLAALVVLGCSALFGLSYINIRENTTEELSTCTDASTVLAEPIRSGA